MNVLEHPSWTYHCAECDGKHCERSVCRNGHCLYKNAKQLIDDIAEHYNGCFFECQICKAVEFWD